MTDSRPLYRTSGGTVGPDQDTNVLPPTPAPDGWDPPTTHGTDKSAATGSVTPGGPLGALGSKLSAVGSSAVAAASNAAATARDAVRGTNADQPVPGAPSNRSATTGRPTAAAGSPRSSKAAAAAPGRQPRKARLTLSHLNVYSVFKFSCVLAIALFFVWLIMVGVLYGILDVAGVLRQINDAVARISGDQNPKDVVTGSVVFGGAIIIGAVYIVLFIAISTIGSMVYNVCADLVGGVEVTLSERE
jgi:hypothetical protein